MKTTNRETLKSIISESIHVNSDQWTNDHNTPILFTLKIPEIREQLGEDNDQFSDIEILDVYVEFAREQCEDGELTIRNFTFEI